MVKITKFGDKIALFWTFELLRKIGTQSRKIGTVGNLAQKNTLLNRDGWQQCYTKLRVSLDTLPGGVQSYISETFTNTVLKDGNQLLQSLVLFQKVLVQSSRTTDKAYKLITAA